MEPRGFAKFGLGAFLVITLLAGVPAQTSSGCTDSLDSLSPCVAYIKGDGSSAPSSSCCTQLGAAMETSPQCVCMVITCGVPSLGINGNLTRALALPGACKVEGPPLSLCNGNSVPTGSSSSSSSAPPSAPTGEGSNTTPINTTPIAGFPNGIALQIPDISVVFLLFIVVSLSMSTTSF